MAISGRISCSIQDVNLAVSLKSGQSFRWTWLPAGQWVGPIGPYLWTLQQDNSGINFTVRSDVDSKLIRNEKEAQAFIEDYLQLNIPLQDLYSMWSKDPAFKSIGDRLPGVRVLRQDPVENLFSFICATNNNIKRITSMVESLCSYYGTSIAQHAGSTYFSFPTVEQLAKKTVKEELRSLSFGYRAGYIQEAAQQVLDKGGEAWLHALRDLKYQQCRDELLLLKGVGPKVADCVCLMSMDKPESVPVDTHMHQLTARYYLPELSGVKTPTAAQFRKVAHHFCQLFGDHAGWAQAVMFASDLDEFKHGSEPEVSAYTLPQEDQTVKEESDVKSSESGQGDTATRCDVKTEPDDAAGDVHRQGSA